MPLLFFVDGGFQLLYKDEQNYRRGTTQFDQTFQRNAIPKRVVIGEVSSLMESLLKTLPATSPAPRESSREHVFTNRHAWPSNARLGSGSRDLPTLGSVTYCVDPGDNECHRYLRVTMRYNKTNGMHYVEYDRKGNSIEPTDHMMLSAMVRILKEVDARTEDVTRFPHGKSESDWRIDG